MTELSNLDSSCLDSCLVGHALDGMCVGLVVTNAAGRVSWMNRSAQRILGVDRGESHGQLLGQLLRDPNMAEFWHAACEADDVVMGEVSVHWPRECELKVNSSKCLDASGACIGRALLFCDVTADRMLQLKLTRKATEQLLGMARRDGAEAARPHAGLTAQELRILKLVGAGHGNEEIAGLIHVAPSTVRTHLKHLYAKLGLSSRAEAISYAIHNDLA